MGVYLYMCVESRLAFARILQVARFYFLTILLCLFPIQNDVYNIFICEYTVSVEHIILYWKQTHILRSSVHKHKHFMGKIVCACLYLRICFCFQYILYKMMFSTLTCTNSTWQVHFMGKIVLCMIVSKNMCLFPIQMMFSTLTCVFTNKM